MAIKKIKDGDPKKPKGTSGAKMNIFSKKPYKNPTTQAEVNANSAFTDKRNRRQMRTAVGATALGTAAALLNTPGGRRLMKKTGQAVVGGVKKGVTALKNIRGTGEYVSNPETGKMERVKKPSAPKTPSARSMRRAEKKSK
jgi:hypothetical protein